MRIDAPSKRLPVASTVRPFSGASVDSRSAPFAMTATVSPVVPSASVPPVMTQKPP